MSQKQSILTKHKLWRLVTLIFAILGPVVMVAVAVAITLYESDWWFNLFAAYLAGILMLSGTVYVSLLTLLSEITRRIRKKEEQDADETPFVTALHAILVGASLAGLITTVPLLLIFYDILNGGFAILHFLCAAVLILVYLILGIYKLVRRFSGNS